MNPQIQDEIKEISGLVQTIKQDHEQELKQLRQDHNDMLAQMHRPGRGIAVKSDPAPDPELKGFFGKGTLPMESKELSVTNDGQGVTVRSQWSDRIFQQMREFSPMRQVASVAQTSSNVLEVLVDRGEPLSAWVGELTSRTKTDASFLTRQPIAVHEHYVLPEVTLQMLEDSQFDVESWLQSKLRNRFARQEAAAFMTGDGAGKPRGILDYGTIKEADFAWGSDPDQYQVGAQYSGLAGDLSNADVLFDLVDSVKAPYLPGASWMMTRAFRNIVRKLKDSQNRYLFEPSLTEGTPDRLLGYPVFLAEDMDAPALDTVGALFGNFREAYTIVDRLSISVQRDAVTKPGWVKYFGRRRVGGALTNPEAVKALVLGDEPV